MATDGALEDARARLAADGVEAPAGLMAGPEGLVAVATHPEADVVLFASSGTAALDAVLAAIAAGKTIALANKEILVMAGSLVMAAARQHGVAVLPVDSEHNAIHQCLHGRNVADVQRLILTASGGPFRDPCQPRHWRGCRRRTRFGIRRGRWGRRSRRFRNAHEQGSRGHRGEVAVWRQAPDRLTCSSIRSRSSIRWWS